MAKTSVLLVDDHADVRFLLRMILEDTEDLEVVGEADGLEPALALASQADVAVIDHRMPVHDGFEVAERLMQARPGMVVLMMSSLIDDRLRARAEDVGAAAMVAKDEFEQLPELIRALRREP